ncbi:hypothetical protein V1318_19015 [Lysobacter sp. CCNWLW3]|uniref:hypothetical protein n=1 Tax=unclassified Lysobacter TaxID=2635362 RepID=UPI002FD2BEC4
MNHTKWDHLVSEISLKLFGPSATERMQEELSKRGAQGWELVSAAHDSNSSNTRLFFKKPA